MLVDEWPCPDAEYLFTVSTGRLAALDNRRGTEQILGVAAKGHELYLLDGWLAEAVRKNGVLELCVHRVRNGAGDVLDLTFQDGVVCLDIRIRGESRRYQDIALVTLLPDRIRLFDAVSPSDAPSPPPDGAQSPSYDDGAQSPSYGGAQSPSYGGAQSPTSGNLSETDALREQIETLRTQLEETDRQLKDALRERDTALKKLTVSDQTEELEALRKKYAELLEWCRKRLEEILEDLRRKQHSLSDTLNDQERQIAQTAEEVTNLEEQILRTRDALTDAQKQRETLFKQREEWNDCLENVELDCDEARRQIEELRIRLSFDTASLSLPDADPLIHTKSVHKLLTQAETFLQQTEEALGKIVQWRETGNLIRSRTIRNGDGTLSPEQEAGGDL